MPESSGTHAWNEYLGKFDVIKLVMTVFFKTGISVDESLAKLQKMIVRDLAKAYPEVDFLTKRICCNPSRMFMRRKRRSS